MPVKKFFTLKEAVTAVLDGLDEESEDSIPTEVEPEICILPPEDGEDSEIEAIDDDTLSPVDPSDVCGQLAVFTGDDNDDSTAVSSETSSEAGEHVLVGELKDRLRKRKAPAKEVTNARNATVQQNADTGTRSRQKQSSSSRSAVGTKWKQSETFSQEIPASDLSMLADDHPELICKTPLELFETFIDDDMFEYLKQQFELYAKRDKNVPDFSTTALEIRHFVGILILSGYHCLPRERDYWSTADDLGCVAVTKTMARNRFQDLKKFCHAADNQKLSTSKVAKLLPVYDRLNKALTQFGVFDQKLSIDESMVPYYGHHGAKMFIRGKPIRFGYKLWMLCSADGFPYRAEIYCGKTDRPQNRSLGEHVILSMLDVVPVKTQHELYFDNFFTSYSLMLQLREMQMKATGTVRDGRQGDAILPEKRQFAKAERGKFHYCCDGNVCLVRWNDNSVVTCASNFDRVTPVITIERRIKGSGTRAKVPQPRMINNYNTGMGGVDLLDRLLSAYRPTIKGKKWWWNLFVNVINIAVVAAWKLQCKVLPSQHLSHLEFRREVVAGLLRNVSRHRLGGPTASVPSCIRYDGYDHYIESTSQGRCALCGKNTKKRCIKCSKRLHEGCFQAYHSCNP